MEVGVEVWLRDRTGDEAWLPAIIHSKSSLDDGNSSIVVRTNFSSDISFIVPANLDGDLDDVKLRNAFEDGDTEDLINLPYLHEPAILCCLEQRYVHSNIYTYTGPILIAVNPFKKVNLYTTQILESYYNVGLLKSQGIEGSHRLSPHVYAVADAAFRNMMNGIHGGGGGVITNSTSHAHSNSNSNSNCNQSILISGESGAGKTESTKIVLRYLTTVGNSAGGLNLAHDSVMEKILQSNPILEAFGNARTIRNDNSSRFGKFIELNFNRRGHLIGGMIRTYLLEKVRLPTQQAGERNFHIFYQMANGGSEEELADWDITPIQHFRFASQGGIFELQHVNDEDEFIIMRQALVTLNFGQSDQYSLFRVLAGLLHLGQLQFVADKDGEGSDLSSDEEVTKHLEASARLCGLDVENIRRTLTIRVINARGEIYEKKLTPIQASDARDALVKAIYGKIFLWIVSTINKSIQVDLKNVRADIGVLDIFGFECFKHNSFEQLCINYTNETLQQQFNQFVFKMEQIEYQRENIEWSFVEFPDNQDCLDLIENKLHGILAMIDDECKLPKASDEKLAGRMYRSLESFSRFSASVTQKRDFLFCINHYAGPVVYSTITFVEKNKDELPKESFTLLQSSKTNFLSSLFAIETVKKEKAGIANAVVASVGSQFKEQLNSLMEKIYSTSPHYIRCLKPNDANVPDSFNRVRTTEQLRYGGVLEAVRVARSGFPVRLIHADFYARYRPLANPGNSLTKRLPRVLNASTKGDPKEFCNHLLTIFFDQTSKSSMNLLLDLITQKKMKDAAEWSDPLLIPSESIQLGNTKVFLRKNAHDILEAKRSKRLQCAVKLIQSQYRCYVAVKVYALLKRAILCIQCAVRVYFAWKKTQAIRFKKASTKIQRQARRFLCRSRYLAFLRSVLRLQGGYRRRVATKLVSDLRYKRNALRVQTYLRMLKALRKYRLYQRVVITLQNLYRSRRARKELRELKIAAKDIGRLKQSNESLKQEIEMLRSKAAEDAKKLQEQLKKASEDKVAELRASEMSSLMANVDDLSAQVKNERVLREEVELQLQEAKVKILSLEEALKAESIKSEDLTQSVLNYRVQLDKAHELIQNLESQLRDEREKGLALVSMERRNSHDSNNVPAPTNSRRNSRVMNPILLQKPETVTIIRERVSSHENVSVTSAKREDVQNILDQLSEERAAKLVLEEEIGRLRQICIDLSAQLDSLKRNSSAITTTAKVKLSGTSQSISTNHKTLAETVITGKRHALLQDVSMTPSEDEEKSISEDSKSSTLHSGPKQKNSIAPQSSAAQSHTENVEKFERNIENLQQKLKLGVLGYLWEGLKLVKVEATMNLDLSGHTIIFSPTANNRRFSLFTKIEVAPIKLSTIIECNSGANIPTEAIDENRLLTIVSTSETPSPRYIAFKVGNKDERNSLVTAIRALSALQQSNNLLPKSAPTASRTSRKKSVRDIAIEEAIISSDGLSNITTANNKTVKATSHLENVDVATITSVEDLRTLLLQEKANNERNAYQVRLLTNDLIDRDEQIAALKKRDAEFSQAMIAKDNMYEQDALVRMQLGKRLEQVLMDKEDALEQIDLLKEQLNTMRESMRESLNFIANNSNK